MKIKMKTTSVTIVLGLAAFGSAVLAEPDLTKLPPASDKQGLTYAKDIRPLFEASCFRCHGAQRPKGGLRLDSIEAALKGGEDGKVIMPGESAKSLLVIAVARLDPETAMPPTRGPRQFGRGPGGPDGPGNPPPGAPGQRNDGPPEASRGPGGPGGPFDGPGAGPPDRQDGGGFPPPREDGPGRAGGFGGPGGPRGFGPPPKPLTPEQVGLIRAWI